MHAGTNCMCIYEMINEQPSVYCWDEKQITINSFTFRHLIRNKAESNQPQI